MRYEKLTARRGSYAQLTEGKVYRVLEEDPEYTNTYVVECDSGRRCCFDGAFFEETWQDKDLIVANKVGNTTYIDYTRFYEKYEN